MYWHVDDIAGPSRSSCRWREGVSTITPRGDKGFVTAAVVDPFGNVLGIMHNPHYLEMLRTSAAV
jgi:hypothetical protein